MIERQKPMFVKDIPMISIKENDVFLKAIDQKNAVNGILAEIEELQADVRRLNDDTKRFFSIVYEREQLSLYQDYVFLCPETTYWVKPMTSTSFLVGRIDT